MRMYGGFYATIRNYKTENDKSAKNACCRGYE